MQLLPDLNHSDSEAAAHAVMTVALAVTRLVRAHAWGRRQPDLTDVQLRTLALINAYPGCVPSALADYLLLSRPAVTRVVDELVAKKLVARQPDAADRRRIELRPTAAGRRRVEAYLAGARSAVARHLADLSPADRAVVRRAMRILEPCFAAAQLAPVREGDPAAAS